MSNFRVKMLTIVTIFYLKPPIILHNLKKFLQQIPKTRCKSFRAHFEAKMSQFGANKSVFEIFIITFVYLYCHSIMQNFKKPLAQIPGIKQMSFLSPKWRKCNPLRAMGNVLPKIVLRHFFQREFHYSIRNFKKIFRF